MSPLISSRCKLLSLVSLCRHSSVMESIAELDVNLPWVVPLETTETLAVIEIHEAVAYIQSIHRCGKALAEVFANREIKRGVLRQVVPRIWLPWKGIAEARAVVDVGGSK